MGDCQGWYVRWRVASCWGGVVLTLSPWLGLQVSRAEVTPDPTRANCSIANLSLSSGLRPSRPTLLVTPPAIRPRPPFADELTTHLTRPLFTANEFSLFMLVCSAHILNGTTSVDQYALHPYLHSFSNSRSRDDLLAPVMIPDVLPSLIEGGAADFSFAAGDFLQVYRGQEESGKWDAVVTCFFIDTAK